MTGWIDTDRFDIEGKAEGTPNEEQMREMLGLKLESITAPIEVIVVDHAERPTGN